MSSLYNLLAENGLILQDIIQYYIFTKNLPIAKLMRKCYVSFFKWCVDFVLTVGLKIDFPHHVKTWK